MVRPGKFKRRRDGGRTINHHLVLDNDGVAVDKRRPRPAQDGEEEEEDEDEEEEDDEDEDEEEGDDVPGGSELSRVERKGLKKKQASEKAKTLQADGEKPNEDEDEDDLITNPNRATKKLTISDLSGPRELTRKEREQKEKQEAKDRYWKLHVQGKTDQARADLSRLAKIRADREAAAAKRKAEAEEKAKALEVAKDAQKSSKR